MNGNQVDDTSSIRVPGKRRRKARNNGEVDPKIRQIFIGEHDMERLRSLIESGSGRDAPYLARLEEELDKARIVTPKEVPEDVITMNSVVRVKDLDTGEESTYRLVFPAKAGATANAISVIAPIGTALLGYREGDVIEWTVPAGRKRMQVVELVYQPERLGNFVL